MSIFIVGKCIGTRQKEQIDKKTGEVKKTWLVGINVQKEGGFQGEVETFSIKVNESQAKEGILQLYKQLENKDLMVPVKVFPYGMDGGRAGISYSLSGDGKPYVAPAIKRVELST